jgi:hypothetical protein
MDRACAPPLHRADGALMADTITLLDVVNAAPQHPYTEALPSAVPVPDPEAARKRIILKGDVLRPDQPALGCRCHTRRPYARSTAAQGGARNARGPSRPPRRLPICAKSRPRLSRKPRRFRYSSPNVGVPVQSEPHGTTVAITIANDREVRYAFCSARDARP